MAESADITETSAVAASTKATLPADITVSDVCKMTVAELKAALHSCGVKPSGKRKREMQLQLMEILTHNTEDSEHESEDSDDDETLLTLKLPTHSSPIKTLDVPKHKDSAEKIFSLADVGLPAVPKISDEKLSVEFQFKMRQMEFEAEERKLRMQSEIEERKLRIQQEVEERRMRIEQKIQESREMREHELALRRLELEKSKTDTSIHISETSKFKVDVAAKLVPKLNENDIESFLLSFEKIAQINAWPVEKYAAILQPQLTGKALKVFTELSIDQCQDYPTLKEALLTAYSVVPEVYRKRFRSITKFFSETHCDFAFRLSQQFKRWAEGENAYEDINNLRELILMEQFRETLDHDLALWLIDQKPKTLSETARLADKYIAVRKSTKKVQKPYFNSQNNNGKSQMPYLPEIQHQTGNEKVNTSKQPHSSPSKANKPQGKQPRSPSFGRKIICAYCKKPGHVIANCRRRPQHAADLETQAKEVSLVRDDSVVHSNFQNSEEIHPGFRDYCNVGKLIKPNGQQKSITLLRDTGSLQSLASKQSLSTSDYENTGEVRLVRGISGDVLKVPLVQIELCSKFAKGKALCGLMDTLPAGVDVLIGNDLCPGKAEDVLAVTRSQTRKANEAPEPDNSSVVIQTQASENQQTDEDFGLSQLFTENSPINRAELIRLQHADPQLKSLFALAESSNHERFKGSYYFIQNGVLMRSWLAKHSPAGADIQQIVAPKQLKNKLLNLAHDIPLAGHLGTTKTLHRLLQNFYWNSIIKDTKEYCRTCDLCQRLGKGAKKITASLHSLPLVDQPFSQVAIDIIGPLERCTESGNRFVLTILDLCTHYPEAIALKEHTAKDIANALISTFSRFGFPNALLSDLAPELQSELMQIFLHEFKISQIRTSPYHPMTDGACEKFNGVLKSMITAVCDQHPYSWDTILPWVLFAYREVPVETTGCSPFEMLFGRSVSGPLALLKQAWINDVDISNSKQNVIDFITSTRENVRNAIQIANEHATKERSKAKTYYDKRARDRIFEINDDVLILLPMRDKPLQARYFGPYKVVEKLGPVDYVVATPDRRKKRRVCHVNLMKAYHQRDKTEFPEIDKVNSVLLATTNITDNIITDSDHATLPHENEGSLPSEYQLQIDHLCQEFSTIFSDQPGRTNLCEHHIELVPNAKPFKCSPYRLNPEKTQILKKQISDLLKSDLIQESQSAYASPVILVPKHSNGWRLCTDLRKLNASTIPDPFPIPRIDDLIDRVGQAKFLTKIDMTQGFLQVSLDESSQPLTGFVTPFGQFSWKVMCFGLRNAPATFSRLVSKLLHGLDEFAAGFFDDILIFSNSWQEHLKHLRTVFTRISNAGLTLRKSKCTFAVAEVDYLGFRVGLGKVAPLEQKVQAILNFTAPKNKKQLKTLIGLSSYYRRFIPNYSFLTAKLTDLLKSGIKFQWNTEADKAFLDLKSRLASRPILRPPDYTQPFHLAVDASDIAIAATLFQQVDDIEHPICYFSRKLDKHQRNYSTVEKEALALLLSVRAFSVYFGSTPVRVYTDHNPLVFLHRMANHNQKLLRWSLELQHYNLEIIHRPGKENLLPDLLSRPSE